MNLIRKIFFIFIITALFSGCSNFSEALSVLTEQQMTSQHPLKSKKDLQIEKLLSSGVWQYQQQADDCNDTKWEQKFHKSRFYQSVGSACLLIDAFSVVAESWHVKGQNLYIVNLSPSDSDDIIIKYRIDFLDSKKLILSSQGYKYTFVRVSK